MKSISGSGEGHNACIFWAILEVVTGIGLFVMFYILAQNLGVTRSYFGSGSRNGLYYYFMGCGIVLGIACLIFAIAVPSIIMQTYIKVYIDRVEGYGLSKWFYWGNLRTFGFIYPINQVSIDQNGDKLIVHGQNTSYIVYVKNGYEIQRFFWKIKNGEITPDDESSAVPVNRTAPIKKKSGDKWICEKCEEKNPNTSLYCKNCGTYN